MMLTRESLHRRRDEIIAVAQRYGAHDVRIFGSVARGDATNDSDVDLIVRLEPGRSLFDLGGLVMDLRDMLGVSVDIISEGSLRGRFGRIVANEVVDL
jgi:predicted nucleotidyltransferase